MFNQLFWIKLGLRIMKIVSFAYFSYYIIALKVGNKLTNRSKEIYYLSVIFATAAGLFNTYLLQPSDAKDTIRLWINFHWAKAILSIIIYTPFFYFLPISRRLAIDIQFYFLLVLLVTSPFARYYREWVNQLPTTEVEEKPVPVPGRRLRKNQ